MATETHGQEKLEAPAVDTRRILLLAGGVLLLIGGAIGVLKVVYDLQVEVQALPPPKIFPAPRVQADQRNGLHRMQSEQMRRLSEYRWVDRAQGLVQIPIERAMQLIAQKGAQAYEPLAPIAALDSPAAGAQRVITPEGGASHAPSQAAPGAIPSPAEGASSSKRQEQRP